MIDTHEKRPGRPTLGTMKKSRQSFSIDTVTIEHLRVLAKCYSGNSMSAWIESAIDEAYEKHSNNAINNGEVIDED